MGTLLLKYRNFSADYFFALRLRNGFFSLFAVKSFKQKSAYFLEIERQKRKLDPGCFSNPSNPNSNSLQMATKKWEETFMEAASKPRSKQAINATQEVLGPKSLSAYSGLEKFGPSPDGPGKKRPKKRKREKVPMENPRDAEGERSYWIDPTSYQVLKKDRQPLCNFCGIPSHPRQKCAYLKQFRAEGKNDV